MIQWMWYNDVVKNRNVRITFLTKGEIKMSGNLRHIENATRIQNFSKIENNDVEVKEDAVNEMPLVHENCNCSGFTMAAVGSALLMFVGIIIYALVI